MGEEKITFSHENQLGGNWRGNMEKKYRTLKTTPWCEKGAKYVREYDDAAWWRSSDDFYGRINRIFYGHPADHPEYFEEIKEQTDEEKLVTIIKSDSLRWQSFVDKWAEGQYSRDEITEIFAKVLLDKGLIRTEKL